MEITIREAAPLLGRSTRAVRARIARGELPARLDGRVWRIDLDHLPMTAAQRASLQRRADEVRRAVDSSLPSRSARDRERRARSALDLEPFALLRELCRECAKDGAPQPLAAVARELRAALSCLAIAAHEFEAQARQQALRAARRFLARVCASLLLEDHEEGASVAVTMTETRILPPIGGLLRWTERRAQGQARS